MRYETLNGVGRKASVICLGTSGFGFSTPEEVAFEILDRYTGGGGNFLDTARVYGDFANGVEGLSEKCLGKWMRLRGNRDKLIIATKGGCHHSTRPSPGRLDRDSLEKDLHMSLEALGIDRIDLYWLHRDDIYRPMAEILETLNGFVEQGLITAFGVSNWSVKRMREADDYASKHGIMGFVANQPQWSLIRQVRNIDYDCDAMEEGAYAYHAWTKKACIPYSSQAKGYVNKLEQNETMSTWLRESFHEERNLKIYDMLRDMSRRTGISASALQLAYLLDRSFPVFPIISASKPCQLDAALEAADAVMCQEDRAALDALVRKLFGTI